MSGERERVHAMFDGCCGYCGENLGARWHVDHVHPQFLGGSDHAENLMPACSRCNLWKKTYSVDEFRAEIEAQAARLRRDSAGFRLAEAFGIVVTTRIGVRFHFEEIQR